MNFVVQHKNSKENLLKRNEEMELKIERATISESATINLNLIDDLNKQIIQGNNRNIYEKQRQAGISATKANIQTWVKRILKKFNPNEPAGQGDLKTLMHALKNSTRSALSSLQVAPGEKVFKNFEVFDFIEPSTPKKISFISKIQAKIADSSTILNFSELNYIDNDQMDSKKITLFGPLIEKTLKKK